MNNFETPLVSRNSPCPCGSGRRYKDCHGAIALTPRALAPPGIADATPPTVIGSPGYRPSGADWDHLGDAEQSACAALMQRALKRQRAGRLAEATVSYRDVLARAPDTHDALHMLGAIELRRGNLGEAKRLIVAALKLRPPYPDIEHNLRMVEDLERAAHVGAGRPPANTEDLCERALPILADLALRPAMIPRGHRRFLADPAGSAASSIHLIAGVLESSDGGAWLFRRLAALLAPYRPTLWVTDPGPRREPVGPNVRRLAPDIGEIPRGGCHVFVGIDIDCVEWIDRCDAERVIVFCQPAAPSQYLDQLRGIARDGARRIELVFPSHATASRFGAGFAVLPPPIELEPPRADRHHGPAAGRARVDGVPVGLIGRHWQAISPSVDAEFLCHVAAVSGALEIYDPGPLRYALGREATVRFHSRGPGALPQFVESVGCLLHTAGKWWLEGDGREVFVAMAARMPVLCPRASTFAEYIDHDVDGLLYDEREDALELLAALRRSPARAAELGRAARAKVETLVAPLRMASAVRQLVVVGGLPAPQPAGSTSRREVALAK